MFQVLCAATKFAQKIDELALKPEFWLNWITMHMRHYGVKDFLKLMVTSPKGFSASKCDVGNWIFSKS